MGNIKEKHKNEDVFLEYRVIVRSVQMPHFHIQKLMGKLAKMIFFPLTNCLRLNIAIFISLALFKTIQSCTFGTLID